MDPTGAGSKAAATPLSSLPQAATPQGDAVVRVVPTAVGERIRATVAQIERGLVWLGYRGSIFTAKTDAALQAGRTYDFEVTRTEPHVELALVRGSVATAPDASPSSMSGSELAKALLSFARSFPQRAQTTGETTRAIAAAIDAWARGEPSSTALRTITRSLGHDLEARVLALADAQPSAAMPFEADALRGSAKAVALALLDDPEAAAKPKQESAQFIASMRAQEIDNAVRAEAQLPTWTPLPACPAAGLVEARMFCSSRERDEAGQRGEASRAPFTAALLLDFTMLGSLRVDVELRDTEVGATFRAVNETTAAMLHAAMPELSAALQDAGLRVATLRVERVVGALPTADLASLPRDGSALVDVHA